MINNKVVGLSTFIIVATIIAYFVITCIDTLHGVGNTSTLELYLKIKAAFAMLDIGLITAVVMKYGN